MVPKRCDRKRGSPTRKIASWWFVSAVPSASSSLSCVKSWIPAPLAKSGSLFVGLSRRTNPQTSRDNAQEAIMSKKAEKNLKKKINARKAKIEKHEAKIKSLKKKLKKAA